jgi:hypothetical protein
MSKIDASLVKQLRERNPRMAVGMGELVTEEKEPMTKIKSAKPFDPMYDYTKDLGSDDIKREDGREFVFLRGLEKLARQRGVVGARCIRMEPMPVSHADGRSFFGGVFCTYEYSFADGGTYQGSADATLKNCDGNFKLYLTAMAESRAKARALRTAFGIGMCSVEEKADATYKTDDDIGPIDDAQIVLIKVLAEKHSMGREDVLELLDVPRKVASIKELTKEEGRELSIKLNKYRPRKSKAKKG